MTDDIEPIQPERQPSPVLLEKISICVDEFRTCIVGHGKLSNAVNEAYAQGESEGIPKEVIASMIRNGILSAGFSDRTVRRYLPQDLKRSGGYGHGGLLREWPIWPFRPKPSQPNN